MNEQIRVRKADRQTDRHTETKPLVNLISKCVYIIFLDRPIGLSMNIHIHSNPASNSRQMEANGVWSCRSGVAMTSGSAIDATSAYSLRPKRGGQTRLW